jgi:transcriptional regulator GlxA family with amidase domain
MAQTYLHCAAVPRVVTGGIIVAVSAITANSAPEALTVGVVVFDGVAMFETAVAFEVFGSDSVASLYRLSTHGPGPVRLDTGLSLTPSHSLSSLHRAHTVIVPPCEAPEGPPETVLRALRRAHARGARLVSLCTGAFVLAAAGLLDGRGVTTHWAACDDLAAGYPRVKVDPDVLYVDDGDILTAAGSAASIDLCLHLVRTDHGAQVASQVARDLVVPPYRDGGQAQYIDTPLPAVDATDRFAATIAWAQQNLGEPITVTALAARSAMSRRTFARHFAATTGTTPYQWLLAQRLRLAQRLLEASDLTIEAVARNSGFLNAGNLRKHFSRSLHTTPMAYRSTFQTR